MSWVVVSIILQALLLIYLQLHEWVPLFPWNDLSPGNPQRPLDVVLGAVQAAVIAGFALRWLPLMAVGLVLYAGWLALQIVDWWKPYLFGTTERRRRAYQKHFGRTYRFLPAIADHPVPDAAHVILQILLAGVCASGAVALVQRV